MVLWVQYQLSVSVINSSVCKEIKHKTTSNTFIFSWKSESHLRGWRWGSWRRPWCRPTPRPPSSSPPSPCLLKISDPCFCPNKLSRLYSFYPKKLGPHIWWWSCLPLQQVTIPGGKWGPTGDLVWILGPTGDLVRILGPTGDWSRRPTAAVRPVRGHTEQTPLLKY